MAEAPGGLARLARAVPALDAFPCLEIPAHSADGAYASLGWQPRAAKTAVQRVAAHGPWLRVRLTPRSSNPCATLDHSGEAKQVSLITHNQSSQVKHRHSIDPASKCPTFQADCVQRPLPLLSAGMYQGHKQLLYWLACTSCTGWHALQTVVTQASLRPFIKRCP